MASDICRMKESLGEIERCPGTLCPYWEGVACGLEQLDFRGRPELAGYLTELRSELESVREAEVGAAARGQFFARLNAGNSD
jgi:hypothetical protein